MKSKMNWRLLSLTFFFFFFLTFYSFPSTIMGIGKERRRYSSERHLKYAIAIDFILKDTLHKKMKFSIKDFFSKSYKIRSYCGFGQYSYLNFSSSIGSVDMKKPCRKINNQSYHSYMLTISTTTQRKVT